MPAEDDAWTVAAPFIDQATLLAAPCACELDATDLTIQAMAEAAVEGATSILYLLSGRKVGGNRTSIITPTPLAGCCGASIGIPPEMIYSRNRRPDGLVSRHWTGFCPSSVIILDGPVSNVATITIDGNILDDTDWQVMEYRYLIYLPDTDGTHRHWPQCDPNFTVEFVWGLNPPDWVTGAALELACRLLRDEMGHEQIIPGLSSASGAGLTYSRNQRASAVNALVNQTRMTPDDFPALGRYLGIVNPKLDPYPTAAWSPDVPVGGARVTG